MDDQEGDDTILGTLRLTQYEYLSYNCKLILEPSTNTSTFYTIYKTVYVGLADTKELAVRIFQGPEPETNDGSDL